MGDTMARKITIDKLPKTNGLPTFTEEEKKEKKKEYNRKWLAGKRTDGIHTKSARTRPLQTRPPKVDVSVALRLRLVNKLTYQDIADKLGVCKQSVHTAIKRFEALIREPEEIEAYRKSKADLLDSAELMMLEKISDGETIAKASLNNAAYTFSQLHQAGRLERGRSTANIDVKHTMEEIQVLEAEYVELQKQLADG